MSDLETLKRVMPAESLTPATVGSSMWSVHKAGMWLDEALWTAPFAPPARPTTTTAAAASMGNGRDVAVASVESPFASMEVIVGISQWVQAEAYRFAYQAGRRRKWHRSLMASWTFDEPWPNAAHGCVVDYYGLPKHAFYTVKQANQMLDVSLSYSNILAPPGERLQATVWVDSELSVAKECVVEVYYFTPAGDDLGSERIAAAAPNLRGPKASTGTTSRFEVPAATATKLQQLQYAPSAKQEGDVVIVRLALLCMADDEGLPGKETLAATNDYTFGIKSPQIQIPHDQQLEPSMASDSAGAAASVASTGGPLRAMLAVASTALSLTIGGTPSAPVLHVTTTSANATSGSPCALYVKPTLRNATHPAGHQLGYVSFSNGFVTLRPGESVALRLLSAGVLSAGGAASPGTMACVEAWNAPRVCVPLSIV